MKDDNLPPDNETVEDGGGCYVAGLREEIINTHYQDDFMKEQDAAHSFDELIEQFNIKDMADKHALNEPHEMQAKVSFFTGANSLLPELTRLRSELQQERDKLTDYKATLRAKVMDISKYDEYLKMKVIELIDKTDLT